MQAARRHGLTRGHYARLTVSDNGCGIAREVIGRAFEPFFTTKPSDQGTMLGLSTVYGIATSIGGNITIKSEPDLGTRVTVLLPISSARVPAVAPLPVSDWN